MNLQEFLNTITRRWWVILATVTVALSGALAYAHHQERIYQASATVLAHPSTSVSKTVDINSDVGLLTYGALGQTFASLAESHTYLNQAGQKLGMTQTAVDQYTVKAVTLPGEAVLQVSVTGPNPRLAARLANALIPRVAAATNKYFPVITLTPLDEATAPRDPIQPRPARDALYGGLAGLIAGYIIAALSLHPLKQPMAPVVPEAPYSEAGLNGSRAVRPDRTERMRAVGQ